MVPIINVKNISREFFAGTQKISVLKDISLSIHQGEMVAIIGASGSGKSTLMNILGCLDKPSSGEIYINDLPVHSANSDQLAELRSQYLGFIFQRYHLMPYLTAEENIAIPALYTAMPEHERQARTVLLANQLGIKTRLTHKPFQLSGGQQQRVSICRALINGAKVILADEPTGALDSTSGKALMDVLHQLHQAGHTIIIVTHDRNIAKQTQRIIEISDGKIVTDQANEVYKDEPIASELPVVNSNQRASIWRRGLESVRMAVRALLGHRMRAFLSMLGIIIGISSVVASIAVGEGAKRSIMDEIGKLGKTTLEVRPGLGWGTNRPDLERALSIDDVNSLAKLSWVKNVSPVIGISAIGIYQGRDATIMLNGVSDSYLAGQGINVTQGDSFHQLDVVNKEPVLILEESSSQILFGPNGDPLNQLVQINGTPWRIIGLAKKAGPKMLNNVIIAWAPYTSVSQRITGDKPFDSISVNFDDALALEQATSLVESHLMQLHGTKDFFIESDDQLIATLQKTSDSMSLLITSIAAISLLVGGVGVMNIMLVSVTERTHEIGIRLSVGARPSDIMTQFLIEAVLICLLGGVIGIAGALMSGVIFSYLAVEFRMIFTPMPILLSCGFSILIGFIFGYFPAFRAAKLNPTEALARE